MPSIKEESDKGSGPQEFRKVRKVWMFSHECAGIAQAGGLGEAVAGLAKTLGLDYNLDVTVFLPSHGRHLEPRVRESYALKEDSTFIAQGYRTGVNGVYYPFLSGVEKGRREAVDYVLVKGLDTPTSRWLDDPLLYDHELTFEKMALFARTVKLYSEYLLSMNRPLELPDLIHANDWHMVPAGVAVKQNLQQKGFPVPLVFTVHLLSTVTLPWHYASAEWCGIEDQPHRIRFGRRSSPPMTYRQVWERRCHNSLERFGCYEADYVTSVSESYLAQDVMRYVGNVIRGKSGHIYNGCDWDPDTIKETILAESRPPAKAPEGLTLANRWDLRGFLLTRGIAQINFENSTRDHRGSSTKGKDPGVVEPFEQDGPLVLMTGRLSPQKGADLLLDAVPLVVMAIPTAKFLLFLLPSGDAEQMSSLEEGASDYPDNVRVIFSRHPQTYMMSHVAADVYAMPSRFEPFGISALEAMVTGNPVVGSNIGGIKETVLDFEAHRDSGTGMLFPPGDTKELAESLITLLHVMQIDEYAQRAGDYPIDLVHGISSKPLGEMVRQNPTFGSKIRENCRTRVERNFRWENAGRMALERYGAAMNSVGTSSGHKPTQDDRLNSHRNMGSHPSPRF